MSELFIGITLDASRARFNVYDFFRPESKFIEWLKPKPKDLVLYMFKKHEGMQLTVPDTAHTE